MKIRITNSKDLRISSLADLGELIPPEFGGEPLNYGQGEGQLRVGNTVWGIYVGSDGSYHLQFEEGLCEWSALQAIVAALLARIGAKQGSTPTVLIEGALEHYPASDKYLQQ